MSGLKGKFIVLDGLDGTGKTVQFGLLCDSLRRAGLAVETTDFPDYNSVHGRLVGRYLDGEFGEVNEVSPYLIAVLYSGDRAEAAPKLRDWLAKGHTVVSNRYVSSSLAYQSAKFPPAERAAFVEWLKELEYGANALPHEDMVIYFSSTVGTAQKMVDQKAARAYTQRQRDIHEGNSDYLAEVKVEFLHLCETEPHWVRIDVLDPATEEMLPPEIIHQKVLAALNVRFGENLKTRENPMENPKPQPLPIPPELRIGLERVMAEQATPMFIPLRLEQFLTEAGVYQDTMTPAEAWQALVEIERANQQHGRGKKA